MCLFFFLIHLFYFSYIKHFILYKIFKLNWLTIFFNTYFSLLFFQFFPYYNLQILFFYYYLYDIFQSNLKYLFTLFMC